MLPGMLPGCGDEPTPDSLVGGVDRQLNRKAEGFSCTDVRG